MSCVEQTQFLEPPFNACIVLHSTQDVSTRNAKKNIKLDKTQSLTSDESRRFNHFTLIDGARGKMSQQMEHRADSAKTHLRQQKKT